MNESSDDIYSEPPYHEAIGSESLGNVGRTKRRKANNSTSNRNTRGSMNADTVGYIPIMDCFTDVKSACTKWLALNETPYKSNWRRKDQA